MTDTGLILKKGTRVQCIKSVDRIKKGMRGTIYRDNYDACVDWDGFTNGHHGEGPSGKISCWNVGASYVVILNNEDWDE